MNTKQADDRVNKLAMWDYTFHREMHKSKASVNAYSKHVHNVSANTTCSPLQSCAHAKNLYITPLTSLPARWQSHPSHVGDFLQQHRRNEDLVPFPTRRTRTPAPFVQDFTSIKRCISSKQKPWSSQKAGTRGA